MERMIIKHSSGSKANQVEEFPLHHYSELVLGRDSSSTVKYDPDRDDLVGRQHAKISRDPADENGFLIEDMNSRNGTMVNGAKIAGSTKLQPGDFVQLGPGGPEFTFDVEPRPAGATKATRVADVAGAPATRVATPGTEVPGSVVTAPAKTTVGKATVERMISSTVAETKKEQGKKYGAIGAVAGLAVLVLFAAVIAGGYWYTQRQQSALQTELANKSEQIESDAAKLKSKMEEDKAAGGISAAEVADRYGKSVVFIQWSWQFINKETKSPIFHQFMPNNREVLSAMYKQNYGKGEIIPGGGNAIPIYVKTEGGYEPLLTDKSNELSVPIGGASSCSGFIVTTDGFILTNRHCASPWKSQYYFPGNYPKGIVFGADGSIAGAGVDPPQDWIPDNTKSVPRQYQVNQGTGASNFDAMQKMTVMLPGSDTQIEAQKIADSPRHDVSMIKISVPGNLPKVELYDADASLKKGDGLVIMGYPMGAPDVYAPIKSKNFLNSENKYTIIPDPTVSVTAVGNIIKEVESAESAKVRNAPGGGDSIRYAQSLTYGGNSGGPVFDMQGRVIAIHFAGMAHSPYGPNAGMGVPIKYGLQLFPGTPQ